MLDFSIQRLKPDDVVFGLSDVFVKAVSFALNPIGNEGKRLVGNGVSAKMPVFLVVDFRDSVFHVLNLPYRRIRTFNYLLVYFIIG